MKRVLYHPAALSELDDAVMYYETLQRGVGGRLLDEVHSIEARLKHSRYIGMTFELGTRLIKLDRFPYGIIIQVDRRDI